MCVYFCLELRERTLSLLFFYLYLVPIKISVPTKCTFHFLFPPKNLDSFVVMMTTFCVYNSSATILHHSIYPLFSLIFPLIDP